MKTLLPIPISMLVAFICFSLAGAAEPRSSPTDSSTPGTPSEVWHTFVEAIKEQDVAAFKRTLATASLEKMEQSLAAAKMTLAESLKSMAAEGPPPTETRNEEIGGDTATIEVKFSENW